MILSVVTTLYCSEQYITEFYRRVVPAVESLTTDYEIVFVDDGSPDDALREALVLQRKDRRVRVVELSRNFGHQKAILAGLSVAKGERVFLIDVDLEEDPELLGEFWREMDSCRVDVVYGVKKVRTGSFFDRWCGEFFYRGYNVLAKYPVPVNMCTVRLMTKEYVRALLLLREQNLFLPANAAWVGFRQQEISVDKLQDGESCHGLMQKLRISWEALVAILTFPFWAIACVGLLLMGFAGSLGVLYLFPIFFHSDTVISWGVMTFLSVWLLGGLLLFCVGVCGVYLSSLATEIKGRPQYLIRRIHEGESQSSLL